MVDKKIESFLGKSILASYIVDEARSLKDFSTVYFYFRCADPQRDNFRFMARSLLSQFATQHDDSLNYIHEARQKTLDAELSRTKQAEELLEVALKSRKTIVMLDGLDECPRNERSHICDYFKAVHESLGIRRQDDLRCLFISQEDGFAKKDLSGIFNMRITPEHVHKDIMSFARGCQSRIEQKFEESCPLGRDMNSIADVLTNRADGMFIFVRLVAKELESQPTIAAIQDDWSPEAFPKDMEGVSVNMHALP